MTKSASEFELGAEAAGGVEPAGDEAVEAVEERGEDDEYGGELVVALEGEAERGEAGAEAEHGDEVRRELAQGEALRAAGERGHQRTTPMRGGSVAARSAITVSPATAAWPGQTSGATPSGR